MRGETRTAKAVRVFLSVAKKTRLAPGRWVLADGLISALNFRYGTAVIFGDQRL